MPKQFAENEARIKEERILNAVLEILTEQGIAGVSFRSVADRAEVALGLINYHFTDKHNLICAALRKIEELDTLLVGGGTKLDAKSRLSAALRRIVSPEFTNNKYLMLRMQVWSLAQVHKDFAEINAAGHNLYRDGLTQLIQEARPDLTKSECQKRAFDIDLIQNGIWLTIFLGLDKATVTRALKLTEKIAFT